MKQMNKKSSEVEIIHRVNRIKKKVGGAQSISAGVIDPHSIQRAKKTIQNSETAYLKEVEDIIPELNRLWLCLKKADETEHRQFLQELSRYSNRIKDMASTYNYELMAYFSESLRDFTEKTNMRNSAHHTIIQAHIDVILIVHKEKLKEQIGKKAENLKLFVAQAIEKHS